MDKDLETESTEATSRVLHAVPRDLVGEFRDARRAMIVAELQGDTAGAARASAQLEALRDLVRVHLNRAFERSFERRTQELIAARAEGAAVSASARAARVVAEMEAQAARADARAARAEVEEVAHAARAEAEAGATRARAEAQAAREELEEWLLLLT